MTDDREERLLSFLKEHQPKAPAAPDREYDMILSRLERPFSRLFRRSGMLAFRPYALALAAAAVAAVFLFTFDRPMEDAPTAFETFFDDTVGDFFASENPDGFEPGESFLLLADLALGNTTEDLRLEVFLDQSLGVLGQDLSETDSWLF